MDHQVLVKHQLFLLWQRNFITKILKVWSWNLMLVMKEALMLLGNRLRALLAPGRSPGNLSLIQKS